MDNGIAADIHNTMVVIPTYNNGSTIAAVIAKILTNYPHLVVVDDGSTDNTSALLNSATEIRSVRFPFNRGKGAAIREGLKVASEMGFHYVVTIDADGQHDPKDIDSLMAASAEHPETLIVGARNLNATNMPQGNTFANRFSNFWFVIETGHNMADTQSGFRLYPLDKLQGLPLHTNRYETELEILVRASWRGVKILNVPITVYYPPASERVSHFRPMRDFTRISILNTVLVLYALLIYWPWRFVHSLTKENIKRFIADNITHSRESNLRISLAVAFGVFMGIFPVWGYQMIIAGVAAHFLGLNKVITLVASNISLPPAIPFLLFGSYVTGGWLLHRPLSLAFHDVSFATVRDSLAQYLLGSVVFGIICGAVAGSICLAALSLFRKKEVVRS